MNNARQKVAELVSVAQEVNDLERVQGAESVKEEGIWRESMKETEHELKDSDEAEVSRKNLASSIITKM